MSTELVFFVNGRKVTEPNPDPEWTLLHYLRNKLRLTGSKLACGEGGCGACTVMVSKYDGHTHTVSSLHELEKENVMYQCKDVIQNGTMQWNDGLHEHHVSVNACLAPVCSMHGLAVTTVEGIGSTARLHPVQARIAEAHGSQCGFCTPGMVMSMYTLLRNNPTPTIHDIDSAFDGNLCRCTGYRPILQGFHAFAKESPCAMGEGCCRNNAATQSGRDLVNGRADQVKNGQEDVCNGHANGDGPTYDPSQEIIFPPELKLDFAKYHSSTVTFKGERVTWIRPTTLSELLALKKAHPDMKLVTGNTEIGIETKFKGCVYPIRVAPTHIAELTAVQWEAGGIRVGANVTLATLEATLMKAIAELPEYQTRMYVEMVEMLKWFAGNQIRNVACIGGNIMTASPISDLNPLLLAASASLELRSTEGDRREVRMDHGFFLGYRRTLVQPQELLVSVLLPFTGKDEYFGGFKQANRREDDIAIVNAGMRVRFEDGSDVISELHLAYGGMAPVTVMATGTMKTLRGQRWDDTLMERACKALESDLPLDPSAPGGTVSFRRTLTTSFFFRFYLRVRLRLHGDQALDAQERSGLTPLVRPQCQASQLYEVVPPDQPPEDAVGRPLMHTSAYKQSTGEAVYVDDMPRLEGELFAAFVLSSKAHARLVNVDVSRALTLTGVRGYVGHEDIPGKTWWHSPEEVSMAKDVVTCQGQVIGCIVADTQQQAQQAVREVKVTYEELEPIITIEEAITKESFHTEPMIIQDGDPDGALRACQHVLEGEIHLGAQEHFYFETHGAIIVPKEDGEMEMFVSTQNTAGTQREVAAALGVPANRIVCRTKRMGGGFGGKETRGIIFVIPAAIAARKFVAPVRFILDRNEDMVSSGTRHPFLGKFKVGFSSDGKILAADVKLYINCGNTKDLSLAVLERALLHSDNVYKIPHFRVAGYPCRTNLPSNTAFRGFGGPQGFMVGEHLVERIAETLSLPPEEVRQRNFYKEGEATHYGEALVHNMLAKCWEQCIDQSDFPSRRKAFDEFNRENRWKKRGIALTPMKFGISYTLTFLNQGGALVHVYLDGSVLLTHGGTEMGQGLHTKMIQVASRALGVAASRVYISETSTATVPNTSPTAASMSSDINGMAVLNACQTIAKRLEPIKIANPKGSWDDWVMEAYRQRISLSTTGFYMVPGITPIDYKTGKGRPFNYFSYGAACSEVELDCLTGDHQVLRTDIVMDVGKSLNPAVDIGQIEGGFMQGYGLFVLEEYKVTPKGELLTRGPGNYKIPSVLNIPAVFNVTLLKESPNTRAVYSSKAIGEPPLMLASSVYFALRDAVRSARRHSNLDISSLVLDCPATPPRLRMACQDQFTQQFPPAKEGTYTPWFVDL